MFECPFCSAQPSVSVKPSEQAVMLACSNCMNPFILTFSGGQAETSVPNGVQDIRQLTQEGSIGAELMDALPKVIETIPVLPEIAYRVMDLVTDPDSSMQDLAELIKMDQVIAMRILRLANSPVYGGLTEIKDLSSACARLGMKNIANAVQAATSGRLYATSRSQHQDMMERLWRHAIATAHCASELAILLAEPRSDMLFMAGLIHDIGKVVLLDMAGNPDMPVLSMLAETPELFGEVMDGYHAILGLHVIQHWQLPAEFMVTTYCHETPEAIPESSWLTAVHTVSLASELAIATGYGLGQGEDTSLLSRPSAKALGLTDIKLASLRVDLEDKLEPLIALGDEG